MRYYRDEKKIRMREIYILRITLLHSRSSFAAVHFQHYAALVVAVSALGSIISNYTGMRI